MDIRILLLMACTPFILSAVLASDAGASGDFRRPAFWMMNREITDVDIQARVDYLAESGIDSIILGGGGHHYLHNDLPNIEQYIATAKRIIDACHERSIKVVEHHSVVLLGNKEYADAHKDWLQCDFETGEPSVWPEYQTYAFCPNNLEFREHYWKLAKRYMVEAGFDALMADDTVFHHGCCCASCTKRWKNEVGGDIREAYKSSRKNGTREWRQFNEVRRQWYRDFRDWLRKREKQEIPDTKSVALLGSILCAWGTQTHGGAIEPGLETGDIGIWEVYNPADFYSWRRLSAESSALAEAGRLRNCVPVCFPYADTVQKRDEFDPEEEVFMWGLSMAHGIPFGLGRVFLNGPTKHDPPRAYYQFERDRLGPYTSSEPVATVGIVFSRHSRDNDPAYESLHSVPAIAWAGVLLDDCIPYRAVTEETLDSGVPRSLKTLILPNVFAMSDKHLAAIERFVRDGGVLIASYLPATRDELGDVALESRRDRLADLLGVRIKSGEMTAAGLPRSDFEIEKAEKHAGFTFEVYVNRFGRGRVYYLPSLIERNAFLDWVNEGMIYNDKRDKALVRELAAMVLDLTPDQPLRITRSVADSHVLTTVRQVGKRMLIHILNSAGSDLSSGRVVPLPCRVVWAFPIDLTLSFPKTPRSIRLISLDSEKDTSISPAETVKLRIPRRYGLLVVDF